MNKYLIFRTDRIGDFLLSAILIKSIKRNDKGSSITLVASKKNYNYIKNINLVDEVIMWPTKKLFEKIKFGIKIFKSKFYCIIVLDGKKRSLYYAIFTRAKYKISIVTKIFYKFIFKFNFTKIIYDDYSRNKIDLHISLFFQPVDA